VSTAGQQLPDSQLGSQVSCREGNSKPSNRSPHMFAICIREDQRQKRQEGMVGWMVCHKARLSASTWYVAAVTFCLPNSTHCRFMQPYHH
jgi:hypothetical protein